MKLKRSIIFILAALLLLLCGCQKTGHIPEITNPGFENELSGWTAQKYTDDPGVSIGCVSDEGAGKAACISSSVGNDVRLIQELAVSPETGYRITCRVKTEGVNGGAGANIGIYGIAVTSEPVIGDADWQEIELKGVTAAGQKTLPVSLCLGGHGALSSGKAYFDDVKIELLEDASGLGNVFGENAKAPEVKSESKSGELTGFPTREILTYSAIATAVMLLIWLWHVVCAKKPFRVEKQERSSWYWVLLILVAALIARIVLSFIFYGHKTDIVCFTAWGMRVINDGPAHFYDSWCDYPPGYMLILGLMSGVYKIVGGGTQINALLVKVPCIIADLGLAYIVYRYAKKTMRRSAAIALLALVAFTPVMAFVSSAWGQIDQALTLAIVIPILLLYKRKPVWAGIVYGAGIIMKPQALMCGPLFAAAYILFIIFGCPYEEVNQPRGIARLFGIKKDTVKLRILETIAAVIGAFAVIILVSIPFRGQQGPFWLVEKYYGTATSYKYATVNAYNFWALIGANWKRVETPFLGLDYGRWGTIFMALSVVISIAFYVYSVLKHKVCKGALPLAMAFMLEGIFMFGHFMHERYIFPALMLLMFAYIFYNDWRLLVTYVALAATMLVNCIAAFYYSKLFDLGFYWDEKLIYWCSVANVALFIWFAYVSFDLLIRNKPKKGFNG